MPFKNDILQFLFGSKSVLDVLVQNIFLEEDQQSRST